MFAKRQKLNFHVTIEVTRDAERCVRWIEPKHKILEVRIRFALIVNTVDLPVEEEDANPFLCCI